MGRTMVRPREFDERQVLDAAVQQFWVNGYQGTSVRDLARATGLTSASLYNAFGDKHALYRRALDHYVEGSFADRVGRFETHLPPGQAIAAFLAEIVARSLEDADRKGCMLVNSALELAPHDPEFKAKVADVLVQIETFFRRCVEAGQKDGTISTAQPPTDLARLLLGVHISIRVLARCRPERDLLEGLVRPALATLAVHGVD